MTNKYTGTLIGLIFSVSSWLATWTFIIPLIASLPLGILLETISTSGNYESYYEIGPKVLTACWIIFITSVIAFYVFAIIKIKRGKPVTKSSFVLFLAVQFFIVHPLFFYIDTSQDWSRASDGQFMFGVTDTFPISSIAFFVFGILLDIIRTATKSNKEKTQIT